MSSVIIWKDIHEIADKVCKHFGLSYGKIVPETRKQTRHYGECRPCAKCVNAEHIDEVNCREKILYIRIHQLNKPRKPLAASTILNTLAHELTHLKHWNHGKSHREFEHEVIEFMRTEGYGV